MPGFAPKPPTIPGLPRSPDSPNFQPGRNPPKQVVNKGLGTGPTYKTQLGTPAPRPSAKKSLVNRTVTKANSAGTPHPVRKQTLPHFGNVDPGIAAQKANQIPKAPKAPVRTTAKTSGNTGGNTGGNTTTPLASATDMVNAQLNPILKALTSEDTGYNTQASARAEAIKSMTQALISQLSGGPKEIGQLYDTAINQNTALADRSAQLLAAANPNQQVQSDLAAIGAPAGQQAQVAQQLGNTFNGGAATLFGTQGQLPGQQLLGDKAAAQTEAIGHLSSLAGLGERNLMDALTQDNTFRSGLNAQRQNVLLKRPGLLQQANQDIYNRAKDARAFAQNQQAIDFATGQKVTASNQAQQRINQGEKSFRLRERQTLANIFGVDPVTGLPTVAGKRAAALAARAEKGPAPSSATLAKAVKFAEDAHQGVAPKYHYDSSGVATPIPGTGSPPILYQQALTTLLGMDIKLVRAQQILNAWYKVGDGGGRPAQSFQQRQAKKK